MAVSRGAFKATEERGVQDMIKNKKGQIEGIIALVVFGIFIFILGPVILKVFSSMLGGFSTGLSRVDNVSADAVTFGLNRFTNFWDVALLLGFVANVVVLFISSFLIDIHPAFIILYILGVFFLFVLAPDILNIVQPFQSNTGEFANQTASLAGTNWLYNNFVFVLLGIVFITGIIMFAKFKLAGQAQQGGY